MRTDDNSLGMEDSHGDPKVTSDENNGVISLSNSPSSNGSGSESPHIWLVGGGIASLAAAVFLIDDAHVPGSHIHILEASSKAGGSMAAFSKPSWETGYRVSAIRKMSLTYHCLYGMLEKVPSDTEGETLAARLRRFNKESKKLGASGTRLVRQVFDEYGKEKPEAVDVSTMGLSVKNQCDLMRVVLETEEELEGLEIQALFEPDFFETNFWDLWSSLNRFHPWCSAVEFRRCLHRMLHEFPNMGTLSGVEQAPEEDFQAIIKPLTQYLKAMDVEFRHGILVSGLEIEDEGSDLRVTALKTYQDSKHVPLTLGPDDLVFLTLGSLTSGMGYGANDRPPPTMELRDSAPHELDPSWTFWDRLALERPQTFGNPEAFFDRPSKSTWLSFTVTLRDTAFFEHLCKWTGTLTGAVPLLTFRDCPWMLSLTIPQQPYVRDQPDGVFVFWGYGLFPDQQGRYVRKPMLECTGAEILTELLHLMVFPLQPTLERSITVPCLMPLIGSPFLTRKKGDRPNVIPDGSKNLGLMGQFVEIEREVTFTMEYSVRSAQLAVYGLMGLDKQPPGVQGEDHEVLTLGMALKTMMT
ncbi:oleate hydratase [Fusarium flagelliforme]|uniref:oleate hydratase n=1 Tax=Fusarium flagelliforme TaxID=2675880 RepID=UPI001E8D19CF|nr:oleate hydratase [Fusarium flagelliforme]KAH7179280.1 oleate hydratase [Fusarium flagelliforme]